MKTLGIIPARSGSKGIKDKNIMPFGGQPLISWTIKQARNALLNTFGNKTVVSTDSKAYKEKIDSWFPKEDLVPFIRPKTIAKDDTPTAKVIIDALDRYPEYETFILLEPTAPLRTTANITEPLALIRDGVCKAVVSVCDSHRCHPAHSFRMNRNILQMNDDLPHLRRQALEPFWHLTGTIYAADVEYYRKHLTFETPKTYGYKVAEWQDQEVDNLDDIKKILPFLERVK